MWKAEAGEELSSGLAVGNHLNSVWNAREGQAFCDFMGGASKVPGLEGRGTHGICFLLVRQTPTMGE